MDADRRVTITKTNDRSDAGRTCTARHAMRISVTSFPMDRNRPARAIA
jgi:hypothetical protein